MTDIRIALRWLLALCLFRAKPQDAPAAAAWLAAGVAVSWLGFAVGDALLSSAMNVVVLATAQTALLGGGWWVVLALSKKGTRWLQSATALFGACALTHVFAVPVIEWISRSAQPLELLSAGVLLLAVRLWFFAIIVHIMKDTLEISTGRAIVTALALHLFIGLALLSVFINPGDISPGDISGG